MTNDPMTDAAGSKKPTRADLERRVAELEARETSAEDAAQQEGRNQARRQAQAAIEASRPNGSNPVTTADLIRDRKARKRSNMTEEEEALYRKHTDPITGLPPLDVSGTADSYTISW